MRVIYLFVNALLVVFLLSCSTQKNSTLPSPENKAPLTQYQGSDTTTLKKAPLQLMPEKKWEQLHLNLEVTPDFNRFEIIGIAELILHPYAYSQNELQLNAQHLKIDSLHLKTNSNKTINYTFEQIDSTLLQFNFEKSITPSDTLTIKIYYQTNYYTATQVQKGYYFVGPKNSDSLHFYTQGEPQDNSLWFPCIDEPNQRSTHNLQVTRPAKFMSFSNGEFQFMLLNGDDTETDYYAMNQPQAPYLIALSVGNYYMASDTISIGSTQKELNYFAQKQYAPFVEPYFERTAEMIPYFSRLYGTDFPWPNYKQVIVEEFTAGAMENTTAVVFYNYLKNYIQKDSTLANNDDYIVAHELVHHWFGDLVTCESWGQLAMNEAFATFGELEWKLASKGKREYLADLSYTRDAYFYESKTLQTPIIRSSYNHPDELFNSHSYAKGGLILNLLKQELDSTIYYKAIQNYLHTHKYQSVEIHDFRLACEKISGKDLIVFFNQWFLSKGHPILTVEQKIDSNQIEFSIKQKHSRGLQPYHMKLPVVLCYENEFDTLYLQLENETTEHSIQLKSTLKSVWVDPEQTLPALLKISKPAEQLKYDLIQKKSTPHTKMEALEQLSLDTTLTKEKLLDLVLLGLPKEVTNFELSEVMYWILEHEVKTKTAEDFLLNQLTIENHYSLRYIAVHALNELFGNKHFSTFKALVNDVNYDVSALAISLVEDSLKSETLKLIENVSPLATLEYVNQISRTISKFGNAEHLPFFEVHKHQLLKNAPEEFLGNYALFLINTPLNEQQFSEGVRSFLTCLKTQPSWWAELIALDTANSIRFALQKDEEALNDFTKEFRTNQITKIEHVMRELIATSKHSEVKNYLLD